MSETLEHWARRLPGELDRVSAASRDAIARLADYRATLARRAAPRRTGDLRRSIRATVTGDVAHGTVSLQADAPGAGVQDTGARITGSPWLAIPIGPRIASSPRTDGPLFAIRSRGRVFLVSRRGGALDLRWRLVRSVTVRGTDYLGTHARALAADVPGAVERAIRDTIEAP